MPAKKGGVAAVVAALAQPVAEELGLELWDVEFVKEGASWFLRIFLDKDGGITLDDCERFHRRIDPVIDEADPVAQSYYLEVSSPGVERELKKPGHFEHELGKPVRVKLFHPDGSGRKELTGVLEAFSDAEITITAGGARVSIRRADAATIKLVDEDVTGGME